MLYSVYYVELNLHFIMFLSLFILIKRTVSYKEIIGVFALAFLINNFGLIDDSLFKYLSNNNIIPSIVNPQILKIYTILIILCIHLVLFLSKKYRNIDRKFIVLINVMALLSIFAFHNTFIYESLVKTLNEESKTNIYIVLSIKDKDIMNEYCDQNKNLYCITEKYNNINKNIFNDIENSDKNRSVLFKEFVNIQKTNGKFLNVWSYTTSFTKSFTKSFLLGYKTDGETYSTYIVDNNSSSRNFIETQRIFSTLSTISTTFWIFLGLIVLFVHKRKGLK